MRNTKILEIKTWQTNKHIVYILFFNLKTIKIKFKFKIFHFIPASNPESKECPYFGKYEIQIRRKRETSDNIYRSKREKTISEHNRRVNGSRLFNFSVGNMSSAPMLRSRRDAEPEVSCVGNSYNRLEVGCNSVKNMEFYSTCENREVMTGELNIWLNTYVYYR